MIKAITVTTLSCIVAVASCFKGLAQTTVGEYLADFEGEDFSQDFTEAAAALTPALGVTGFDVSAFPALYATNLQAVKFFMEPCGIIPLHVHPRGDEFFYVLKGDNVKNFFIHESGPKILAIGEQKNFVLPEGYVHGHINDSCESAEAIAVLNAYDSGVLLLSPGLVSLPNDLLGPMFNN